MTDDARWMGRALTLAARGWGRTSPNPMVGAVVVRDGRLLGAGYHQRAGTPHAEIHALAAAGEARGATLYVTLEPCCTHGRTPPCTDAIVGAGIRRVVAATADPNPRHAGRGFDLLRTAGIAVDTGVLAERAATLNEAFFTWVTTGRPFVLLKLAQTADGRIATATGQSRWITGPTARARVQRWRRWADAILVGGATVRADDPELLVRTPAGWPRQPLRLVASRGGDLGAARMLGDGRGPVRVVRADTPADWRALLSGLGAEGITALLVEGGGELAASLLAADAVDKVALFIAPKLLGGRGSRPAIGGPNPSSLDAARPLRRATVRACGEDFLLTGYLHDVYGTG